MVLIAVIVAVIAFLALIAVLSRPGAPHALGEARQRAGEWLSEFADWVRLGR